MAEGIDRSEDEIKHEAAEIINGPDGEHTQAQQAYVEELNLSKAVSELRVFCIRNKHPCPSFDLVEQTGPQHAPKFTVKCTVGEITEYASASTKKGATHLAAQNVLKIIQPKSSNTSSETASEAEERMKLRREKMQMYRNMKKSNEKNILETIDMDRHNYFKNFPKDKKTKAYEIMNNAAITSSKDKMDLTLKALQIPYKVQEVAATRGSICLIELDCELDVVVAGTVESVYDEMIKYLQDMLR